MSLLVLLLLGCVAGARSQEWANDYDGYLYFECPPSTFSLETCSWSGYVNDYDEVLVYECSSGAGLIAGMESEHDNGSEDRRWNYKCCFAEATCYHDCHFTPYINDYDEAMDYSVQDGYVVVGMESEHDNKHEDRKWRLQVCKIQNC